MVTAQEKLGFSFYHAEALQLLVETVFPSASVIFSGLTTSRRLLESNVVVNILFSQFGEKPLNVFHKTCEHHPLHQKEFLKARQGPLACCSSEAAAKLWGALYQKWPPQLVDGRRLWREKLWGEEEKETLSSSLPCWTPHAVVYIGGYEGPDLRRVVAPRLFAHVPPFSNDSNSGQTAGGETFDYGKRRVPKFASKVLNADLLLREKGCALHEPDMLELAIPVTFRCTSGEASSYETRRVQTFLSCARCDLNPSALGLAVDPMQRRVLRPAFGYSLAALKYSLPPPLVAATRLLRRWNALWSATPLSTEFWLSAVGHVVERLGPAEDALFAFLCGDAACTLEEVARRLALTTGVLVNKSPQECLNNFFLPVERFDEERGVRELMDAIGLLPVTEL